MSFRRRAEDARLFVRRWAVTSVWITGWLAVAAGYRVVETYRAWVTARQEAWQRRGAGDEQRRGGIGQACTYPHCDCPPNGQCGAAGSIYEDPREAS